MLIEFLLYKTVFSIFHPKPVFEPLLKVFLAAPEVALK